MTTILKGNGMEDAQVTKQLLGPISTLMQL